MEKQFILNLTVGNKEQDVKRLKEQENNIEVLYVITNTNTNTNTNIYKILNLANYVIIDESTDGNNKYLTFVRHPYKSKIIDIEYIDFCDEMNLAKEKGELVVEKLNEKGFGKVHITSTVYYKDGEFISDGTNSDFHLENGCIRKEMGCKSGEGYEYCIGCQPINHSEQIAIKKAKEQGNLEKLKGATAYLYGHYWSCESCTKAMELVGIKKLYLSKEFTKNFLNIKQIQK